MIKKMKLKCAIKCKIELLGSKTELLESKTELFKI